MNWPWKNNESAAFRRAREWERQAKALVRRLASDREELGDLLLRLQQLSKRLEADLERAEESHRKQQTTVDQLRSELKIAEESTIPILVSANKLAVQRFDAMTAFEVRKQVAAGAAGDES